MQPTEKNDSHDCPDHRIEHIRLGIPDIPLCPEEWITRRSSKYRYPPLEHLIERAKCHTEGYREESCPTLLRDDSFAKEDLSREKCGDESLREVSDFIIVVASLTEDISDPVKKWDFRIGVVPTDTEDDRMDEDKCVEKIRQRKSAIRHEDEDQSDESREDLEEPREIIMWRYRRPDKDEEKGDEEGEVIRHR